MRTKHRAAVVFTGTLFLAACSPGMYTGGGWAETAGVGEGKASFSFSVESCDNGTLGHFSLHDEGWRIPVEISGYVMDFGELGDFGDKCSFYAPLEYASAHPKYPGEGHAVVCFGNDSGTEYSDVSGNIWVTVQSGPYEAYENYGPIFGNVQSHGCDG